MFVLRAAPQPPSPLPHLSPTPASPLPPQGPHFWDECPYPPKGACTAPPNGDFDGYVNLFEKGASQIKANPLVGPETDRL